MNDLVERLRAVVSLGPEPRPGPIEALCKEAADEIVSLRDALTAEREWCAMAIRGDNEREALK